MKGLLLTRALLPVAKEKPLTHAFYPVIFLNGLVFLCLLFSLLLLLLILYLSFKMDILITFWRLLGIVGVTLLCIGADSAKRVDISEADIQSIFSQSQFETARDPITYQGRNIMRNFLRERLTSIVATASSSNNKEVGVIQAKYRLVEPTFRTKIYVSPQNDERTIEASNFIVIFEGESKKSEDEPLIILANYDTEETETNAVDDNGSGIVTLVALGHYFAHQISSGKMILNKTVILAATDMAIYKYTNGAPINATSGAEELVRRWLPSFMDGRKKFRGAIVLDSIMNFNEEPRSQVDSSTQFSKAFPRAYKEMSEREFKGNFLAVVHREDELDSPLAEIFARGWKKTGSDEEIDKKMGIINFVFSNSTFASSSPAAIHFLRSEQTPFWNHFAPQMRRLPAKQKELPALLITDTEKYRRADCVQDAGCTVKKMTTEQNVAFLARTANALVATIKELQMDHHDHNSSRGVRENLSTLFVSCLTALVLLVPSNI